jgi:hypothetical protein
MRQATNGEFGVMVGYLLGIASDEAQVQVAKVGSDFTRGSLELVDGQDSMKAYAPARPIRGATGRVHGLLWERDRDDVAMYHTLVSIRL